MKIEQKEKMKISAYALPKWMKEKIQEIASENHVKESQVVRGALEGAIEDYESVGLQK